MCETASAAAGVLNVSVERSSSLTSWFGWKMVLAGSVVMACTLPGRTHALGLITNPLLADIPGLSETRYATINLIATLLGSLLCLPTGWLIDRYGARIVGTLSTAVLGGLVLWMSRVETATALGLAVLLTRTVGQSMLSVVSLSVVGKAFPDRRSMAMGVYAVLLTILLAVGTGLVMSQVSSHGWRAAWSGIGFGLLSVTPFLLWLLNGRSASRSTTSGNANIDHDLTGATLGQALQSPGFWLFAICVSFFGLTSAGISLFQQSILIEQGLGNEVFQFVVIGGLLIGLSANLFGGWLATRYPLENLMGTAMLLLSGSLLIVPLMKAEWHAYLYCFGYAAAGGMITVLFFAVWGQSFGTRQLGRIQGAAQTMTVVASAVGPLTIAYSHERFGSHREILFVLAAAALVLGCVAFRVRLPRVRMSATPQTQDSG